jgi:two-component system, cell cycle sensor histidine kinase and response regulator CckA
MKMIQELAVTATPTPRALRIMVVDDEEAVRRYADRVLRAAGYQPVLAANGFEALRLAASMGGVDALVTDLMMPDMNGAELARRLRQEMSELKVLYMSGFCDDVVDPEARLTGREAFLEKPYSIKALEQAVSMLIYGDLQPPS